VDPLAAATTLLISVRGTAPEVTTAPCPKCSLLRLLVVLLEQEVWEGQVVLVAEVVLLEQEVWEALAPPAHPTWALVSSLLTRTALAPALIPVLASPLPSSTETALRGARATASAQLLLAEGGAVLLVEGGVQEQAQGARVSAIPKIPFASGSVLLPTLQGVQRPS